MPVTRLGRILKHPKPNSFKAKIIYLGIRAPNTWLLLPNSIYLLLRLNWHLLQEPLHSLNDGHLFCWF